MFTTENRQRRMDALLVYLILEGASALFIQLTVTIYVVYYATAVGLDPFQIVLFGTIFETTIFLFEIPTGIVADVYSRRLSIIIGVGLMGVSFTIMGLFPILEAVLLAEIIQGIGATFTSGATQAWIADEIGEARVGKAFVRAAQVRTICGMIGIVSSVLLASIQLGLPIVLSGLLLIGLMLFLIILTPETGFQRMSRTDRSTWQALFGILRQGIRRIRVRPLLVTILAIQFIFAFHTEGFDHLWQKHVLDNFVLPGLGALKPIVWFGIIGIAASLLGILLNEIVRRRVNLDNHTTTARALLLVYGIKAAGIFIFGLASNFAVAVAAYWLVMGLRDTAKAMGDAWLNQHLEPRIRATMFSLAGQTHAIGEIVGGPPVGAIGSLFSVRAAITTAGVILAFTFPLFAFVLRRQPVPALADEQVS
jgi:MFS transporter, DHA3 family, tetracycline resistance protein